MCLSMSTFLHINVRVFYLFTCKTNFYVSMMVGECKVCVSWLHQLCLSLIFPALLKKNTLSTHYLSKKKNTQSMNTFTGD